MDQEVGPPGHLKGEKSAILWESLGVTRPQLLSTKWEWWAIEIVLLVVNIWSLLTCKYNTGCPKKKGDGNDGEPDAHRKTEIWKKGQNWLELKKCGWFGVRIENIQFDPPKEIRGQSWPRRSLQKQVKMTSNFTLVDGLGLELKIFNLTIQKRSEAKVDLRGCFKNRLIWLQIAH